MADRAVITLDGYSTNELVQLAGTVRAVKAAALLDVQRRFLADIEAWVQTEIGLRAQAGARAAG